MLTFIGDVIIFSAGFAACWFSKDTVLTWVLGAKAVADKLEARASAIKAAL